MKKNTLRREKLAAKRHHTPREFITDSTTLTHGQKCHIKGWFYDESWHGLGEKYLFHFAHRASPIPQIWGNWKDSRSRTSKAGQTLRALCTPPEEDEPKVRMSQRHRRLLESLAPYDEGFFRKPERSWKTHRKTQWKPIP